MAEVATAPDRPTGRRARLVEVLRSPATIASLCIVLAAIVANAVYIFGIRTNNPVLYYSGLGTLRHPSVGGEFTIDPNIGWTSQALGRAAIQSWLHGHVPLWNSYEGLGQPLAGEMQSAAFFFPFVFLLALPNGIFLMHLALELVAGFGTLLFLRSLRLSWVASTCGACLFALNGSFSVMTNAPFNPIAFLPVALWGVELVVRAVKEGRRPRGGVWVIALSVALMLFAGFPETAFLEMLFVGVWAVVRLIAVKGYRRALALWLIGGVLAGVALAAPILIAFKDFLDFGYTAYHAGSGYGYSYKTIQTASAALPFVTGSLWTPVFGAMAGYVLLPAVLAGLVGYPGRGRRALRVALGLVLVLLVLNMFNVMPVRDALNLIPGMKNILIYKYGWTLVEFAVVIFAAYGIDDLRRAKVGRRAAVGAATVIAAYLVGMTAWIVGANDVSGVLWTTITLGGAVLCTIGVGLAFVLASVRPGTARVGGLVAALVVGVYAVAIFAVPQASASPGGTVDLAPVSFLQKHLGTSRFYSLSPISPNYGSYWGIAQINADDLPVPKKYASYVLDKLSVPADSPSGEATSAEFKGYLLVPYAVRLGKQRALFAAYGERQEYFRQASVKYLVTGAGVARRAYASRYGLTRVFHDAHVDIWEDAKAEAYYTTTGGPCTIHVQSRTAVSLYCSAPAILTRHELSSPGWTATVNHKVVTVADSANSTFQSLSIPAGDTQVTFSYVPKYFVAATVLSLAVAVLMLVDGAAWVFGRRRAALAERVRELLPHRYRELAKFIVVGGLAWFVDVGLFTILAHSVLSSQVIAAKVTSILVATVVSYVANRQWSFNTRGGRKTHHEAVLFFLVNGIALVINLIPLWLSHYVFGFNSSHYSHTVVSITDFVSANIFGNVLALVFRYWAYRRFVFPDEIGHVGEDDSHLEPHSIEAQLRGQGDS